jgi:hypothetical protein
VPSGLDKAITWRDALELGLFFGVEYAMLALIEDAPFSLKAATMIGLHPVRLTPA